MRYYAVLELLVVERLEQYRVGIALMETASQFPQELKGLVCHVFKQEGAVTSVGHDVHERSEASLFFEEFVTVTKT